VFVNGQKRGVLSNVEIVEETIIKDDLHDWWGDEQRGDTLWHKGDKRFWTRVSVPAGDHRIAVKCADGAALESDIHVAAYNRVKVSCMRRRIKVETEND
jgi:hypothetical protein